MVLDDDIDIDNEDTLVANTLKEAIIDILFISETKLDDNVSEDRFNIEGFNHEILHRNRHGG